MHVYDFLFITSLVDVLKMDMDVVVDIGFEYWCTYWSFPTDYMWSDIGNNKVIGWYFI